MTPPTCDRAGLAISRRNRPVTPLACGSLNPLFFPLPVRFPVARRLAQPTLMDKRPSHRWLLFPARRGSGMETRRSWVPQERGGMFTYLGGLVARRPWLVCAVWLVVGAALAWAAPSWDKRAQDDDVRFLPDRCPSVRGYKLLEKAFPQDVFASRVIFAVERPDGKLSENDL